MLREGLALSREQRGRLQTLFAGLNEFGQDQRKQIGTGGLNDRLDEFAPRYRYVNQAADRYFFWTSFCFGPTG